MWVKRTQEEITTAKKRRRRGRIQQAMFLGVGFGLLTTFIRGGGRSGRPLSIVPLEDVPRQLPFSVFLGFVAGLIFYCFPGDSGKNVVCPKCGKVESKHSQPQCSCGGHFEDGETMKWV
jgi:hypothetical protein